MEQWRRELYHSELYHYGVKGMKWGKHLKGREYLQGSKDALREMRSSKEMAYMFRPDEYRSAESEKARKMYNARSHAYGQLHLHYMRQYYNHSLKGIAERTKLKGRALVRTIRNRVANKKVTDITGGMKRTTRKKSDLGFSYSYAHATSDGVPFAVGQYRKQASGTHTSHNQIAGRKKKVVYRPSSGVYKRK